MASIFQAGRCTVVNNFDGHLQFECPHENQFISHITSVHDNHREDRVFDMSCADFPIDVDGLLTSCTWTEYVNDWDGLLAFECNDNMYISGLQSDHDNHREDRRWKVKCCEMHEIHLADCHFTAWTNAYDGRQYLDTGSSHIMKGIISIHDNHREDRIYKFETCKVYRNEGAALIG